MGMYEAARRHVAPFLRFIFGIKGVSGDEFPKEGPVIVCSNHRSNFDPVILGSLFDSRNLHYMAKAELFKIPVFNALIKAFGAFPIHRGKADKAAIVIARKLLHDGNALVMFPEGTRTKNMGAPRKFKPGIAMFAYKSHAPILPVLIETKGHVRPFKKNIVKVGKLITFDELGFTDGSSENLHAVTATLYERVTAMMDK